MRPTVAAGIQDFEQIRKNNYFLIDKTDFIREWWKGGDAVTLICRPRRFGKTLNMDMLYKFFSVEYASRGDLFEGLSVWEHEELRPLQGTYPVIFLSFAGVKGDTCEKSLSGIKRIISAVYEKHGYLMNSDALSENEKKQFLAVTADMDEITAAYALNALSTYLERHYKRKVLILLDEYDTPLQEAYVQGYWKELVSFTRGFFNLTLKTNPSMERAVMTGITRVSKESMFSDLNNLQVVTTTSEPYSTCFGFTETEVFKALDDYGLSSSKQDVKEWYDGFTFGGHKDIYNPWSIIGFLKNNKLLPYWSNTGSNSLAAKLLREGNASMKKQLEDLIDGGTFEAQIDEEIVFNQLDNGGDDAVWSLLLAAGYLKVEKAPGDAVVGEKAIYVLSLTNQEVRYTFRNMVNNWFTDSEACEEYNEFIKSMLNGDLDGMNEYMNEISTVMFSSFDAGNKPSAKARPERFYHGFVLGLLVELEKEYRLTSNRESGRGRYDIMLQPLDISGSKPAFIIEFKVKDERRGEKTLADTAVAALNQINERKYETELIAAGISKENIKKYGFAFEGKTVLIAEG